MDAELDRVLAELESRFDAALARQEEQGANDLAAGLRQERLLRSELQTAAAAALVGGGARQQVSVVGRDYVGCGWPLGCVIKMEKAVVALEAAGSPPAARDDGFIEVVRRWQRAGLQVELEMDEGSATGMLDRVAADHILLRTRAYSLIVPLPAVVAVRLFRGG